MSLFISIVKDGEEPEQSNQNGQFFNTNNPPSPQEENIVNNGIVGNPDVFPGGENLVVNNIEQNNVNTTVCEQNNKKQRVQSTFGKCAGSVIISLFIFLIAIYIFFGNILATLVYDILGIENIKLVQLTKQSGIDDLLLKLILSYCWVAVSYSILSLGACLFAVKDSFRKKFIPSTDIKPYKVLTSIFFIVFFMADYWIVLKNCEKCSELLNNTTFNFLGDMIEKSSYYSIINSLPIICCAIVTVFLILTIILCNKTTDKKNAI